jgi:uncharacterized protein YuzB (UPF0349 family)
MRYAVSGLCKDDVIDLIEYVNITLLYTCNKIISLVNKRRIIE